MRPNIDQRDGTSFGYGQFLRLAGADPRDVLLAEFDLANNRWTWA